MGPKLTILCLLLPQAVAFLPSRKPSTFTWSICSSTTEKAKTTTSKPTGTSFLPDETLQRAQMGSPIEKIKLEKDGSSAWTDVYEYAKKIREGTMTWEEVESAGEILAEPS